MELLLTMVGHPASPATLAEMLTPKTIPRAPPSKDKTIDSTRNCARMSRPRAPTAIRIPISRILSVTETSIMFMIPIPPTRRLTEATPPRR